MNSILDHHLLKKRRGQVQETRKNLLDREVNPDRFCIMPFVNLILEPNGSLGICRQKGTEFSVGNISEGPIDQLWNKESIRSWRRDFLDGSGKICDQELRHRQCQLCPELNKMLPHTSFSEYIDSPPLRLTANLNGKCNLECQMCHVWKMPNGLYNEENFWIPAREKIFPFLKEVDMLSGEPFIQADTYRLIDEISELNPDCEWSFTTNAHWLLNKKIMDSLEKIKVKNLMISIDSLEMDTYAIIRKKGNLELVLKNIKMLKEYEADRISRGKSGFSMNLNALIQKDNWREAKNFIDWGLENEIHPFVKFCYEPVEHSLLDLSPEEKMNILDEYLEYEWDYLSLLKRVWYPVVDSISTPHKAYYLNAFLSKRESFGLGS
jgi:cyclic pyranopterin phosphate synthase